VAGATEIPMSEMSGKDYRKALEPLQEELNVMHRWLQHTGQRLVVLFEGRDTAGRGHGVGRVFGGSDEENQALPLNSAKINQSKY